MSWTKKQLAKLAFSELGLARYAYDLRPEQWQEAVAVMESMVAAWNEEGIRIGFSVSSDPESVDPDVASGIPDWANRPVYMNLAIALAPRYGKTPSSFTAAAARSGYDALALRMAMPVGRQLPAGTPVGAGNKPWSLDVPFTRQPEDDLGADPDGGLTFN